MGVPGGGRNEVTDRFLRHMQIITIDSFDDNTLGKIFTTILDWHFAKGYASDVARLSKVNLLFGSLFYPFRRFSTYLYSSSYF